MVTEDSEGTYTCTATNNEGTETSALYLLQIQRKELTHLGANPSQLRVNLEAKHEIIH